MEDPKLPAPVADDTPDHLSSLTDLQQAFVCNLVTNGGDQRKAALAAGYAQSSADAVASRMMRNPRIILAIWTETQLQLGRHAPMALGNVARLAKRAKSEHVRLGASQDLLDRAGLTAPKKVQVAGQVSVRIDLS